MTEKIDAIEDNGWNLRDKTLRAHKIILVDGGWLVTINEAGAVIWSQFVVHEILSKSKQTNVKEMQRQSEITKPTNTLYRSRKCSKTVIMTFNLSRSIRRTGE